MNYLLSIFFIFIFLNPGERREEQIYYNKLISTLVSSTYNVHIKLWNFENVFIDRN